MLHIDPSTTINSSNALLALEALRDEERKNFSFYKPHPKHLEFHNLGLVAKDRLFLAANRIGKTQTCSMEVCFHLTGNYPYWWKGYRYNRPISAWVGCISASEVRDLEARYFEGDGQNIAWLHPSLVDYSNRTEHIYRVLHKPTGRLSHLAFKTYGQKREGWQAKRLDLIHLDEESPMDILSESGMRLMSTSPDHHGMLMISSTCLYKTEFVVSFTEKVIDVQTEEYGKIITRKEQVEKIPGLVENGSVYIVAGWQDALHLTEEEKERQLQKMPIHERQARTTGIPSVGSGMVYPLMQQTITCDPFEIPDNYEICAGIDFGWSDPTAIIFIAIDPDTNIKYVFAEYRQNEKTPQNHLYALSQMRTISSLVPITPFACDPSGGNASQIDGTKLIELYEQAGVSMYKADNTVYGGTQTVLQMLQNRELVIFSNCTMLLSEIRSYSYDEKGKVKKGNDHLCDALRYVIVSGLNRAVRKSLSKSSYNNISNNYSRYTNYNSSERLGFV